MKGLWDYFLKDLETAGMQEENSEFVLTLMEDTIPYLEKFDPGDEYHRRRLYGAAAVHADGKAAKSPDHFEKYKDAGAFLINLVHILDRL